MSHLFTLIIEFPVVLGYDARRKITFESSTVRELHNRVPDVRFNYTYASRRFVRSLLYRRNYLRITPLPYCGNRGQGKYVCEI